MAEMIMGWVIHDGLLYAFAAAIIVIICFDFGAIFKAEKEVE